MNALSDLGCTCGSKKGSFGLRMIGRKMVSSPTCRVDGRLSSRSIFLYISTNINRAGPGNVAITLHGFDKIGDCLAGLGGHSGFKVELNGR